MEDTLVDPLLALEPADLAKLVGQLRAKSLGFAKKSPNCGARMPNWA